MQLESDELPESLKKGVLTAGHTRIVLSCECPQPPHWREVFMHRIEICAQYTSIYYDQNKHINSMSTLPDMFTEKQNNESDI